MAFNLFGNILNKVSNVTGIGLEDKTQSSLYKALAPYEQTAQNVTGALQDTARMYEQKAQNISQWSQNVANKPGYIRLGQMIKRKYPEYNDLSDEELGQMIKRKYPEYQDIVSGETTALGYGAKALGGIGSMAVSAPGMVAGGAEQLGTGIGTIASAQSGQDVAKGALQAGKGALQAGFGVATGAMPISSTVFGGATGFDTVQQGMGYVGQKAGDLSANTAKFLGGNEGVQEQARGFGEIAVPALALKGVSVGGKYAKPIVNATGRGIVKGVDAVAPVAKTIIKKPVQVAKTIIKKPVQFVKNKATDIFGKELRAVEDIAGNILQPYKGMVENLDDATNGLRRVVEETGTSTDTFQGLLGKIDESLTKYGKMKQESLGQITQTRKSVSAQKALENLENVYDGVSSKEMLATQSRVRQLAKKNMQEGLTPLEMDEVKVLHTKANNLFNEKGQTTGGFSSDDLRGIRKDLKNEIEDFAEANGVTNIREINKAYGEIADAKTLAQNQVDNLKAYKGRQIPATRIQKIADFIMEFPVVKQAFSDPARILASSLFKTLRGDKINPIEVQKRLPNFLKELKEAGMRSGDLQKIEMMIQNEIKLIGGPTGKPLSAKSVNLKPSTGTPNAGAVIKQQGIRPKGVQKTKPVSKILKENKLTQEVIQERLPTGYVLKNGKRVKPKKIIKGQQQ